MFHTWVHSDSPAPGLRCGLESLATQKVTKINRELCLYPLFRLRRLSIDDMIFAVVGEDEILRVPNASMIEVMWDWLTSLLPDDGSVEIEDPQKVQAYHFARPKSREI